MSAPPDDFLSPLHAAVQAHCESLPAARRVFVVGHVDHGRSLMRAHYAHLVAQYQAVVGRPHVVVIDEPPSPGELDKAWFREAAAAVTAEPWCRSWGKPQPKKKGAEQGRRKWRVRR